jgi:hypothetical protein
VVALLNPARRDIDAGDYATNARTMGATMINDDDEYTNAQELIELLVQGGMFGYWAPGDATVYRVAYGSWWPLTGQVLSDSVVECALIITIGRGRVATPGSTLIVSKPPPELPWSAGRFYATFGSEYAGWWAGVRPLLAALGWVTSECTRLEYEPTDAVLIDMVARERVVR